MPSAHPIDGILLLARYVMSAAQAAAKACRQSHMLQASGSGCDAKCVPVLASRCKVAALALRPRSWIQLSAALVSGLSKVRFQPTPADCARLSAPGRRLLLSFLSTAKPGCPETG